MKKVLIKNKGYLLIQVLVFAFIATILLGALTRFAVTDIKASRQAGDRELAIHIAEAGVDYYRWHLAHAPTDYQDGTEEAGPYTHDFKDKDGNIIGQFILDITAPPLGSSLVAIKSTGKVSNNPDISRAIQTKLAKPSIAKYAVVANANMRFGAGTEVFGPIHVNGGMRFDGLAHNIVSSSLETYTDLDTNYTEYAIYTTITPRDPFPPTVLPSRSDIFEVGRQLLLPIVDFSGMTADLAQMRLDAIANGFHRASSTASGYHLILKTNDTFDLYKVNSVKTDKDCNDTWSIKNESLIGNYPFPTNGLIFLEDNIWVNGQINTARLNIISATLPDNVSTRKNIIINGDLLYTNYDGTDTIGLIAQNNINIGLYSEDDLRIDAALIAQNGRVGRNSYSSSCSSTYYKRQTITLYGMIATYLRYGFAYTDGSGYQIRNLNYDANLLYSPPPSFPLTSDQYQTLTWDEVK
jgi:hypothetical protein